MKELTKKYIEKSEDIKYYTHRVEQLNEEQQNKLENLIGKLANAGAKNPLSWAMSEVTEGIPQFGRFLILKNLFGLINHPKDSLEMAEDVAEDYEGDILETAAKLSNFLGEKQFNDFLKAYTKGVMWEVATLLDEGNHNFKEDGVDWVLNKVDQNGHNTGQAIQGLHEDFQEFENEI